MCVGAAAKGQVGLPKSILSAASAVNCSTGMEWRTHGPKLGRRAKWGNTFRRRGGAGGKPRIAQPLVREILLGEECGAPCNYACMYR